MQSPSSNKVADTEDFTGTNNLDIEYDSESVLAKALKDLKDNIISTRLNIESEYFAKDYIQSTQTETASRYFELSNITDCAFFSVVSEETVMVYAIFKTEDIDALLSDCINFISKLQDEMGEKDISLSAQSSLSNSLIDTYENYVLMCISDTSNDDIVTMKNTLSLLINTTETSEEGDTNESES